jgi:hypothetical protein
MAKRSTPSKKKAAKKAAAPARKAPAKKAKAPAKKAVAAKGAARAAASKAKAPAKKAASAARKGARAPAAAARKAAPVRKSAPVKKTTPAPRPAAAPPKKAAVKKGRARRAAAVVKSAARAVAAVVGAPVKAVAAVVAGPVVEGPPPLAGEQRDADEGERSGNGVDVHASSDGEEEAESHDEAAGDPASLLDRIESAYGVTLPERYRRFLESGEYRRYPRIELAGYIRGPYDMDFVDDLLADVAELGQNAGIYDMDDVPWSEDYAGYVPLASLSHPEVDEPKVFLVHQVKGDQHRVLLFDYEGWRLYPLADSFESFLANLPRATNDIATAFRPGA